MGPNCGARQRRNEVICGFCGSLLGFGRDNDLVQNAIPTKTRYICIGNKRDFTFCGELPSFAQNQAQRRLLAPVDKRKFTGEFCQNERPVRAPDRHRQPQQPFYRENLRRSRTM